MARSTSSSRPGRTLVVLAVLIGVLFGVVGAGVLWSNARWGPKLALDLEGGTQIVLTPVPQEGQSGQVTDETIAQAVTIIRQRINGSGVSEAEITTQGGRNIVVALPGRADQRTRDLVKQSAQLQFRAVLVSAAGAPQPVPTPTAVATPSAGASPKASGSAKAAPSPKASSSQQAEPVPSASDNGRGVPAAASLQKAVTPTTSPTASPGATKGSAAPKASPAARPATKPKPATKPTDASDPAWVTGDLEQKFTDLDCSDPKNLQGGGGGDLVKPFVTCATDGTEKYILGPAEVIGTDIKTAAAGLKQNSQGNATGEWEVQLSFTGAGTRKFADVTTRLATLTGDRNRFAIVLDGTVISAPTTNERIPGGQASITGNFTQASAQTLANQLKFGALPISFRVETEEQISALLGGEQLRRGLLAGLIGLILVVAYSLLQYRALGLVTVASLAVVGLVTYGLVLLLSWRQGYRLSLPGVAGLIVSIGVTADSFIVFFERVRDEVRDGRPLLPAVEAAWNRARRTILVSDGVSLLGAVVLFVLAVGGVRGFAFTLGLTTIVDILIVFLFTKPMVTLLARTRFFGGGHRLSGFDAEHLGRSVAYTGRGTVRTQPSRRRPARRPAPTGAGSGGFGNAGEASVRPDQGQSIAARRAAERAATAGDEPVPQARSSGADSTASQPAASGRDA